jgi:UDP-glucose 4-epimerase
VSEGNHLRQAIRKVLVTGGCGFIGSTVVRDLLDRSFEVVVLDDLSTGTRTHLDGLDLELIEGSVLDDDSVYQAIQGVNAVIHLAALTKVVSALELTETEYEINVGGTLKLLKASVDVGIERFVLASSMAVLGELPSPVHEGMIPVPLSSYGASKLSCEGYCAAFSRTYGLSTVALRFANAYGPYSTHKETVISRFLGLIEGRQPVPVYGDGQHTRDYVHVSDVSAGILQALENQKAAGVIHIGTGTETSVAELISILERTTGLPVSIEYRPARAEEIIRNYTSISKAQALLGFHPRIEVERGVADCWDWFRATGCFHQGVRGTSV